MKISWSILLIVLGCYLAGCGARNQHPNSPKSSDTTGPRKTTKSDDSRHIAVEPSQLGPPPKLLTSTELDEDWISLFDGQTSFGWQANNNVHFRIDHEQHTICLDQPAQACLLTTTQFGDCELALEYRGPSQSIGGVLLGAEPDRFVPTSGCYEIRIGNGDKQNPEGSLVGRKPASPSKAGTTWIPLSIRLAAKTVTVKLGDRTVLSYTDPHPLGRGRVGLYCTQGNFELRNIKLKPLGLKPIFNGRDLTGWKTYPDMPSVFRVTKEGWLHVKNGRGQLETQQSYSDFVLQLECITHAPNLNSGIFFRCIPGQQMNGYECQIHNGFKDGDRTHVVDCGTGGIFRRQNARRIVSDDMKWFHETIVAEGPHMAVWIDGYQVTDWTDTRKPNENPRRGLRLEPGTIIIQGHDPTTDISFRNLRIAEIPARPVK